MSPLLFFGFAIASIGGPLALVSLYAPGAAGGASGSLGLVTLSGVLLFAFPLLVWLGYSRQIVSGGGLYAFVQAAVGTQIARVQALIWAVSYFLYLPYTVTFVVYDLLPVVFPGIDAYRWPLELLLPVGLCLLAFLRLRILLAGFLVLAAIQLALLLLLTELELSHLGAPGSSFSAHGASGNLGSPIGNVSLLLVCGSLPLFLGAEVRGGAKTVRASLAGAYALVGAYFVVAAFPLARAGRAIQTAAIPGVALASAYTSRPFAIAIGLGTVASVGGLIMAEYIALSRLMHALSGAPLRKALGLIAVPFVLADGLSLIDPQGFYNDLLTPSLVALYLAQLIVFAVYPLYTRHTNRRHLPAALIASAVACALMGFGLYTTATTQL